MEEAWLSARHQGADERGLGSEEAGGLGLGSSSREKWGAAQPGSLAHLARLNVRKTSVTGTRCASGQVKGSHAFR